MPRTKTVSDDAVLEAVAGVLRARGPHAFTLADVSAAAGVSPATLVQRFGTKRGLLVAFTRHAAEHAAERLGVGSTEEPLGLRALRARLVAQADAMGDRGHAANDLAMLLEDVRDEELRAHARAHAERSEQAIRAHLAAAVTAGELADTDVEELARVVWSAVNGATIAWALRGGEGARAGGFVGRVLDALLAPLRREPKPKPRPKPKPKKLR